MPTLLQKPAQKFALPVITIAGPRSMDAFMHAADVFEPFKALATVQRYEITFNNEPEQDAIDKVLEAIKSVLEKDNRVVAVFSPNRPGGYVDETVKVVSNGMKWVRLDNLIASLNCGASLKF